MNIFVIYLSTCPHSIKAVSTLKENKIPFKELVADDNKEQIIQENLSKNNNYRKFPQIYIDNKFIGGNDRLQEIIHEIKRAHIPKDTVNFGKKSWLKFINNLSSYL